MSMTRYSSSLPLFLCGENLMSHGGLQFIGPEDPRLFFTNDGQPLLIYSQTGRTPMICRAIFVIDARMVVPGLQKALAKAGWHAPIVFRQQTGGSASLTVTSHCPTLHSRHRDQT